MYFGRISPENYLERGDFVGESEENGGYKMHL
jgi:hypothetical protein